MMKATILPHLVEMMETGKRNYEIEQSGQMTIAKIPETSPLYKNNNNLLFSPERKRANVKI